MGFIGQVGPPPVKPFGPIEFVRFGSDIRNNPVLPISSARSFDWTDDLGEPIQQASFADGMIFVGGDGSGPAPNHDRLYAVDARSGRRIWSRRLNNMIMTTPVVADDMVYVGTGNQTFAPLQYLRQKNLFSRHIIRGTGSSAVYGLSEQSGRVVWKFSTRGEDMPSLVYHHGTLYAANGNGTVYAVSARSGKQLWAVPIGSYVSMAAPLLVHHTLYVVGAHPYRLYGVNVQTHRIRFAAALAGVFAGADDCSPVWADGTIIFTATAGSLAHPEAVALAYHRDGTLAWRTKLGAGSMVNDIEVGAPSVSGSTVFMGSPFNHREYAVDIHTGQVRWTFQASGPIAETSAIDGDRLYVGDESGMMYVLNAKTGHELASQYFSGKFSADFPLIVGKTLYQPDENGQLFALPASSVGNFPNGARLPLPSGPLGRAIVAGQAIFTHSPNPRFPHSCATCHQGAGTQMTWENGAMAPNLLGVAAGYPQLQGRHILTLNEQINHCWAAMGDTPLAQNSRRLAELNLYLHWLSSGWSQAVNFHPPSSSSHKGGC